MRWSNTVTCYILSLLSFSSLALGRCTSRIPNAARHRTNNLHGVPMLLLAELCQGRELPVCLSSPVCVLNASFICTQFNLTFRALLGSSPVSNNYLMRTSYCHLHNADIWLVNITKTHLKCCYTCSIFWHGNTRHTVTNHRRLTP